MSSRVEWSGLTELIAELRRLPDDLADEAGALVLDAADNAKDDADSHYPERTGKLRKGIKVETVSVGRFGAGARVVNTSPHAHLFENGTQTRQTAIGANRGSMPVGNVFVPAMIRWRRRMYEDLKALLRAHGLEVSGDA